jgi:hypothetical protein
MEICTLFGADCRATQSNLLSPQATTSRDSLIEHENYPAINRPYLEPESATNQRILSFRVQGNLRESSRHAGPQKPGANRGVFDCARSLSCYQSDALRSCQQIAQIPVWQPISVFYCSTLRESVFPSLILPGPQKSGLVNSLKV